MSFLTPIEPEEGCAKEEYVIYADHKAVIFLANKTFEDEIARVTCVDDDENLTKLFVTTKDYLVLALEDKFTIYAKPVEITLTENNEIVLLGYAWWDNRVCLLRTTLSREKQSAEKWRDVFYCLKDALTATTKEEFNSKYNGAVL